MYIKGNTLKSFLFQAWGYLIILVLSAGYIATCVFTFGDNGKPADEIFSEGALYLLLGLTLSRLFTSQGIMNGMRDETYLATVALHAKTVIGIEPYMDRLDAWCADKTAEVLAATRRHILLEGGMRYEQCFDASGAALPFPALLPDIPCAKGGLGKRIRARRFRRKLQRTRKKIYLRAMRAGIYPLCAVNLTGIGTDNRGQPFDFGKTLSGYANQTMVENIVSRVISTVIFSFFGVKLVDHFTWEELLFRVAQLAVALGLGAFSMYRAYMHVVEEQRGNITRKIDYLKMFEMAVGHGAVSEMPAYTAKENA